LHFLTDSLGFACGTGGVILRTTDGGESWTTAETNTFSNVFDIQFRDTLVGAAGMGNGEMLETSDGGISWNLSMHSTSLAIRSISYSPSNVGIAVGDSGLIMTRSPRPFAGWEIQPPITAENLYDVEWLTAKKAVAVGAQGTVVISSDIGASWQVMANAIGTDLYATDVQDTTTIISVGPGGGLETSTDGGQTWTIGSSGNRDRINSVSVTPGKNAIAVGTGGFGYRHAAGSSAWLIEPGQFASTMYTSTMVSDSVGVAAGSGGSVYRTTDGGASWAGVSSGITQTLYGSTVHNGSFFLVGSGGTILRSSDDGVTWSSLSSGTTSRLRSITFAHATLAVAVGFDSTIIRSTDGGLSWSSVSSPINTFFLAVCFGDSSNGFIGGAPLDAGLPPTLLRTSDGGLTWEVRYNLSAPPSANPFAFFDIYTIAYRSSTEYIMGSIEGAVFHTTDLGESWNQLLTGTMQTVTSLQWLHDRWIAVGSGGMILESPTDSTVVRVQNVAPRSIPRDPLLVSAYPNPFNPSTMIQFSSLENGRGIVTVYNMIGQKVTDIFDGMLTRGQTMHAQLDAASFSSGMYVIRFTQGKHLRSLKLLLVR
jgi:photosystem II stability/assembly factor-like uncharacterized protein